MAIEVNARRKIPVEEKRKLAIRLIEKARAAQTTITREAIRARTGLGKEDVARIVRKHGQDVVRRGVT